MLSVDLALDTVFRALPGHNTLTYLNPKRARIAPAIGGGLNYLAMTDASMLDGFDAVIFWGDFFHWLPYARWDWAFENPMLEAGLGAPQLVDQWYRLFLLEHQCHRWQGRLVLFGGTWYGMTARQLADTRYSDALTALYGAARLVAPRDLVSASLVPHVAPQHAYTLGCDCALLLDADTALPMAQAQQFVADTLPARYVVCAFGRSEDNPSPSRFAEALAARLQARLVVMDWLGEPEGLDGLAYKLAVVRRAVAVVTDTYHLAVSGWREGVPVVGMGRALSRAQGTLDDKKKELFFRQILAGDYYLYTEEVDAAVADPQALQQAVRTVEAALGDSAALAQIRQMVALQTANARHYLLAALVAAAA